MKARQITCVLERTMMERMCTCKERDKQEITQASPLLHMHHRHEHKISTAVMNMQHGNKLNK